jgi:DNA-binding response OmpR family regulator
VRVLVVEDAPKLRLVLESRLRDEGYAVDGAATGMEAVRSALADPYDAIVLDLRLPDGNGIELYWDRTGRARSGRCDPTGRWP